MSRYNQFLFPYGVVVVFAVAVVLYAVLYALLKGRREKPGRLKMLAEFVFVGWICMFVYITLILSFGSGMGSRINLVPFDDFRVAFRYGSDNAVLVWQNLLNIVMVVPLGFLLPVIFPEKMRSFVKVLLVSFGVTLVTETIQFFIGRGSDINDVIANTVGGVCGYAIFMILSGVISAIRKTPVAHCARSVIAGLLILCLAAVPFVAVRLSDGKSEFGDFNYSHSIPTTVVIPDDISRGATSGRVYKASPDSLKQIQGSTDGIDRHFAPEEWDQNTLAFYVGGARIECEFVKEVSCVSPYEAVGIAREVGVRYSTVTAEVTSVERGYSLIGDTGYVVPTWDIKAKITPSVENAQHGEDDEWNPVVDAMR
jgi:glycopeptide antibiotics resistance protein